MPQRVTGTGFTSPHSSVSSTAPRGYLALIGPSPLRFAPPPPEPVERPVEVKTKAPETLATTLENPVPPPVAPVNDSIKPDTPAAATTPPVSILPDDTPHDIRPEDVLPYFQLPSQSERIGGSSIPLPFTPAVPGASTLPPSSATYQQK